MRFSASIKNRRRARIKTSLSMLKGALLNSVVSPCSSQSDYLIWYHMIACESHRQMLVMALGILAGEIKDMRTDETRKLADEMMPWSVNVT